MRRDCQHSFLEGLDGMEVEISAVQLFRVVSAHRKPEGYGLVRITRVYTNQGKLRSVKAREQNDAGSLVPFPAVEEKERATPDLAAVTPDPDQLPD
jgi:hypothetical protein